MRRRHKPKVAEPAFSPNMLIMSKTQWEQCTTGAPITLEDMDRAEDAIQAGFYGKKPCVGPHRPVSLKDGWTRCRICLLALLRIDGRPATRNEVSAMRQARREEDDRLRREQRAAQAAQAAIDEERFLADMGSRCIEDIIGGDWSQGMGPTQEHLEETSD